MDNSPKSSGFTLVELIIVIILIGIVSLFASSRYVGSSSFSTYLVQSEVLAALRLVQNRAMNRSDYCNRWLLNPNQTQAIQVSPSSVEDMCSKVFPSDVTDPVLLMAHRIKWPLSYKLIPMFRTLILIVRAELCNV